MVNLPVPAERSNINPLICNGCGREITSSHCEFYHTCKTCNKWNYCEFCRFCAKGHAMKKVSNLKPFAKASSSWFNSNMYGCDVCRTQKTNTDDGIWLCHPCQYGVCNTC